MLRPLADDLWCADQDFRVSAGFYLPIRMTVIRIGDALWLHSPIALDDAIAASLAELGPVRWLVAPNCLHYAFVAAAKQRYPDAEVYAPAALRTKRPEVPIDHDLEPSSNPWATDLDVLEIGGAAKLGEFVFHHRATATLLASDLLFNLHDTHGAMTNTMLRMAGALRRPAQSRFVRFFVDDRARFAQSAETLLGWDIRRVVMAHGDILEGADAKSKLAEALTWMRAAG